MKEIILQKLFTTPCKELQNKAEQRSGGSNSELQNIF